MHHNSRSRRYRCVAKHNVASRRAKQALRGRFKAQSFLNDLWGARGVEKRFAQMWAGEEDIKHVADGAGHRDMAGNHEIEWQAGDFDITQRRIKLQARCDQRADQIISRVVCALSDGCEKVTLQRHCAFSVGDPLLDRTGLLH